MAVLSRTAFLVFCLLIHTGEDRFLSAEEPVRARILPVRLESSHSGSSGFFASKLDGCHDATLLLVDAHCDLRRDSCGGGDPSRAECDTWIDCLPRGLVASLVWVDGKEWASMNRAPGKEPSPVFLSSRAGDFKKGIRRWPLERAIAFLETPGAACSWVATIDIDCFVGSTDPAGEARKATEAIIRQPGLRALSIAVSRPWLPDDAWTDVVLLSVLETLSACEDEGLFIIEFSFDRGGSRDHARTLRAAELKKAGSSVPEFRDTKLSGRTLFAIGRLEAR